MVNRTSSTAVITTSMMKIESHGDGIIRAIPLPSNTEHTIENAKQNLEAIVQFADGKKALILNDMRQMGKVSINREAREFMAGPAMTQHIKAFAVLVNSPVGKIFGNFWMRINKPSYPTQLFTSEAQAIEWLKSFQR